MSNKSLAKRAIKSGVFVIGTVGMWSVIYPALAIAWFRSERKAASDYKHSDEFKSAV